MTLSVERDVKQKINQIFQGQWVWCQPKDRGRLSFGGQVTQVTSKSVTLLDDDGKKHEVSDLSRLKSMDQSSVEGVEDMIMLGDLNEASILRNLEKRFKDKEIYVSIGLIRIKLQYE